ncbi:MAG: hypothetical protein AAGA73_12990 [Pseudomonadota bacterium]
MASTVEIQERGDSEPRGGGASALMVLGIGLVLLGALMLVYLGMILLEILRTPSDVELVTVLLQQTQQDEQAFFGQFGESAITFSIGEPLRSLVFVLLLLWILSAIANIIKGIIAAGRDLVAAGRRR